MEDSSLAPLGTRLDWGRRVAERAARDGRLRRTWPRYVRALALDLVRRAGGATERNPSPEINAARAALTLARPDVRRVAFAIECLALADVDRIVIAHRTDVPLEAVIAYEELIFSARAGLTHREHIYQTAIATELDRPPRGTARRRAAQKIVAYECGVEAFDDLYSVRRDAARPWRHPAEIFARMAAAASVDVLAELALGPAESDPKRLRQTVHDALEQLRATCAARYAEDMAERDAADLLELAGGFVP